MQRYGCCLIYETRDSNSSTEWKQKPNFCVFIRLTRIRKRNAATAHASGVLCYAIFASRNESDLLITCEIIVIIYRCQRGNITFTRTRRITANSASVISFRCNCGISVETFFLKRFCSAHFQYKPKPRDVWRFSNVNKRTVSGNVLNNEWFCLWTRCNRTAANVGMHFKVCEITRVFIIIWLFAWKQTRRIRCIILSKPYYALNYAFCSGRLRGISDIVSERLPSFRHVYFTEIIFARVRRNSFISSYPKWESPGDVIDKYLVCPF